MKKRLLLMTSLISFLFISSLNVYASEFIEFPDERLEVAILEEMGKKENDKISVAEAQKVQFLPLSNKGIQNLEGIQYFENVNHLQLGFNQLTDITPLHKLDNLNILDLQGNQLEDISPLEGLEHLVSLNLNGNNLGTLESLTNIHGLSYLYVNNNQIKDISPTAHLEKLDVFDYSGNQVSDISCLTRYHELRYGDLTKQQIVLPTQKVKKGSDVIIDNPIKTVEGGVEDITVKNGIYDESTNQIMIENVTEDQTVEYAFEATIDYPKYGGEIDFTGTVTMDIQTTLGGLPILYGVDDIEIPYGKEFDLLEGVTAQDAEGVDLTEQIVVEGEIDVFTAGDYEIIYRVTDSEGQVETVHRLVTVATPVIGNQSPVINAQNRIVNKGDSFNPLEGVTAMDEEDGELTANIEVINNTVNVNEIGIYEVTYRVQDSNGATTIITVDVEVHDIPTTGFSLF